MRSFTDRHDEVIDQGLLIFFPAPHSFTGEDVVECHLHGSPVVVDLFIDAASQQGARLARPGEFSERAFLNGRIDLAQAEAIADLIESATANAARMASRSLQGVFSEYVHELVERLIQLRLHVEAAIDFPEEEIDFLSDGIIADSLSTIEQQLGEVMAKARQGSLLSEGIYLVIAGLPNAGKSSILNALSGQDTAIVTELPGTTRDALRTQIHIDGMPVHLVDTAGLREAEDIVEQEGIRRARQHIEQADHILWVYDASKGHREQGLVEAGLPAQIPVTFVRNKIDQLQEQPSIDAQAGEVALSAKQGDGMDLLKQQLKQAMGYDERQEGEFLARRRHVQALEMAQQHLQHAAHALHELQAGELLAEELRLTQQALAEITGEFTSDDLLGRIFSSFCIGK